MGERGYKENELAMQHGRGQCLDWVTSSGVEGREGERRKEN